MHRTNNKVKTQGFMYICANVTYPKRKLHGFFKHLCSARGASLIYGYPKPSNKSRDNSPGPGVLHPTLNTPKPQHQSEGNQHAPANPPRIPSMSAPKYEVPDIPAHQNYQTLDIEPQVPVDNTKSSKKHIMGYLPTLLLVALGLMYLVGFTRDLLKRRIAGIIFAAPLILLMVLCCMKYAPNARYNFWGFQGAPNYTLNYWEMCSTLYWSTAHAAQPFGWVLSSDEHFYRV
ncbi:hypothetical protein P691DRAFT_787769 [Macrolepiota fuliginosa MF-IS2]|uniref:Uncharacterized protein n=1 Tax=Macrolepiota fuliginosa MF-IS2 TaxID=1400762 RepID=A0A9P5XIQ8_9AGAR|nr:hypothetical protein P691DRAFT_787769 [Macrolepiota fuliginosa MF-IS2]